MKMTFVLLIAFLCHILLIEPVVAQEYTSEQIAVFKQQILQGCIKRGIEKGDNPDDVRSLCHCAVEIIKKNLSDDDMREIMKLSAQKTKIEKIPQLQSLFEKFKECKKARHN
jgi:hypothetical protein